jgi:ribonucleoside-diphosphate reductase subunit M1
MYYLRTRAAADAIKFTVDQTTLAANQVQPAQQLMSPSRATGQQSAAGSRLTSPLKQQPAVLVDDGMTMEEREAQLAKMICSLENKDACLMCGS